MPKINHKILRWARETAGLSLESAAEKLKIGDLRMTRGVDRLAALEEGELEPTRPLLMRMAKQYRRPLLTFYLPEPPRKGDRGQDFRTLPNDHPAQENIYLDALIRDIRARQSMIRAILEEEEGTERLTFVGSVKISDGLDSVLASIRQTLQMDLTEFRAQQSADEAFALLRAKTEAIGVFVLLIGNLGSHHTAMSLETFRGFALADDIAPFIIINDQDSHKAWSFTLIHELVHLWLGETGVSGASANLEIEKFCNDVAGEFFLPARELAQLDITKETKVKVAEARISEFANKFNISSSMVAYRLFSVGTIGFDTWKKLSATFRELWLQQRDEQRGKQRNKEGGPSYYVVRRHHVGNALLELVGRMMAAGDLTTTKAGKVLGVKAKNVRPLIESGRTYVAGRAI